MAKPFPQNRSILKSVRRFVPVNWRSPIQRLRGKSLYIEPFDKNNCIFIHVPKAAGTAVSNALFGVEKVGHWSIKDYEWEDPLKARSYYKFCIVRHPFDRLVSAYFYLINGGNGASDRKWAENNIFCYRSFEDFVLRWISEDSIWEWVHFYPQAHFISTGDGDIGVDFIGRFEDISGALSEIGGRLHVNYLPLQRANVSPHRQWLNYYNNKMMDKIRKIYSRDFSLLQYE